MKHLLKILKRRGSVNVLVLFIILLALAGGTLLTLASLRPRDAEPIDRAAYDQLMASQIQGLDDLLDWFYDQQDQWVRIIPPGLEELIQPGLPDVVVLNLDGKGWPEPLQKALSVLKPTWRNSVPTYELELHESPNGEITISDTNGNFLHTVPTPNDYQVPYEALFRQSINPLLYEPWLNRYKLRVRITLLPQDSVEHYLYAQAEQDAYAQQMAVPEQSMMLMSGGSEELAISGMELLTNGFRITVTYPASYSGQVWSVYQQNTPALEANLTNSFNGLESTWTLTFNNLALTGETATSWTDLQPMGSDTNGNPVHRFYGVGSNEVDSDGDGLNDAVEQFVYHTLPGNPDTDGDNLPDGWEVANGLNARYAGDASSDEDGDSLSALTEFTIETDPKVWNQVIIVDPLSFIFGVDEQGKRLASRQLRTSATTTFAFEYQPYSAATNKFGFQGFTSGRRYLRSDKVRVDWDANWFAGTVPQHCTTNTSFLQFSHEYQLDEFINGVQNPSHGYGTGEHSQMSGSCCVLLTQSYSWFDGVKAFTNHTYYSCGSTSTTTVGSINGGMYIPSPRVVLNDQQEEYLSMDAQNYGDYVSTGLVWYINSLTNEYTTALLEAQTESLLTEASSNALGWVDSIEASACRDLNEGEAGLSLSAFRYRIRIGNSKSNKVYILSWSMMNYPEGSYTGIVRGAYSAIVAGDGGDVLIGTADGTGNYRAYEGGPASFTVGPPSNNGCLYLAECGVSLASDQAANSPKAFRMGNATLAEPCGKTETNAEALVVYFNQVFNYETKEVEDFDINLQAGSGWSSHAVTASWIKVSGPDSGNLLNLNQVETIYRNPSEGGTYEFNALISDSATRANVWLPTSFPDITHFWTNEIDYLVNTWGPAYRFKLNIRTLPLATRPVHKVALMKTLAATDMNFKLGRHLDWQWTSPTQFDGCGLPNSGDNLMRMTISGVVVDWRKRNNMLFALIAKEMGIFETLASYGADPTYNPYATGRPDTPATKAAYEAGFDLSDGDSLQDVMSAHGYDMQEPDSAAQREWPSREISYESLVRLGQQVLQELIQ